MTTLYGLLAGHYPHIHHFVDLLVDHWDEFEAITEAAYALAF